MRQSCMPSKAMGWCKFSSTMTLSACLIKRRRISDCSGRYQRTIFCNSQGFYNCNINLWNRSIIYVLSGMRKMHISIFYFPLLMAFLIVEFVRYGSLFLMMPASVNAVSISGPTEAPE